MAITSSSPSPKLQPHQLQRVLAMKRRSESTDIDADDAAQQRPHQLQRVLAMTTRSSESTDIDADEAAYQGANDNFARSHTHANEHEYQEPDVVADELKNLKTLLMIDSNLPPYKTPTTYRDKKQQQKQQQKPRDPLLRHVQGSGVEFEDVSYYVMQRKQRVQLLHGITGVASKGEVTAIMGPRGAGKSTLLNALAGRLVHGDLDGFTMLDGRLVAPPLMKRVSTFIMQGDQLFPMLTVWETLLFAAEMRLDPAMARAEKLDRVTKLVDQLGLTSVRNRYTGDQQTRGICNGAKRRVSIGVDIIHSPALLFMDYPTSGLDSSSANFVMEKVSELAKTGSTVILTIHQPSFRAMQFMNRLIVLARGQLIYQGGPNYISKYLGGLGRQIPRGENPMEYFLDVVQNYDKSELGISPLVQYNLDGTKPTMSMLYMSQSPEQQDRSIVSERPPKILPKSPLGDKSRYFKADDYNDDEADIENGKALTSPIPRTPQVRMPQQLSSSPAPTTPSTMLQRTAALQIIQHNNDFGGSEITPATPSLQFSGNTPNQGFSDCIVTEKDYEIVDYNREARFANQWWREVVLLMIRNFTNFHRTPELLLFRQVMLTGMCFVMATLFIKARQPSSDLDGTILVSFFIITVCLFFFSFNFAVPAFVSERLIYIRETSHSTYRASSYVVASAIVPLPFLAIECLIYAPITGLVLGLQNTGNGGFTFFFLILLVSLLCSSSVFLLICSIVPTYMLGYAVVMGFAAVSLLTCGFFLDRSHIPKYWLWLHYLSTFKYPFEAMLVNEFGNAKHQLCYAQDTTHCQTGVRLLENFHVNHLSKWWSLGVLLSMAVFYRLLFYCVLRFGGSKRPKMIMKMLCNKFR